MRLKRTNQGGELRPSKRQTPSASVDHTISPAIAFLDTQNNRTQKRAGRIQHIEQRGHTGGDIAAQCLRRRQRVADQRPPK